MELSAFRNLFGDLQEYVCSILNQDELLSAMGAEFYSENSLDIEYQVKTALAKTGLACLVLTPRATYQGHNGIQQTFTCDELTLQIVENPVVNRPRLKRDNLDHGTAMDIAKQASDRLAGPQGGYFGKFTTKRIQEAEQSGLLVVTATFGCTVYETLSAVISGDLSGNWVEVPFVRMSELSDWIDDYLSTHVPVPEVSGYLPLSGGMMTGDISCGDAIGVDFNGIQVANGELGDGFAVYVDGTAKYAFYDTNNGNPPTPMPPQSESDINIMRGMDVYAVLGDLTVQVQGHELSITQNTSDIQHLSGQISALTPVDTSAFVLKENEEPTHISLNQAWNSPVDFTISATNTDIIGKRTTSELLRAGMTTDTSEGYISIPNMSVDLLKSAVQKAWTTIPPEDTSARKSGLNQTWMLHYEPNGIDLGLGDLIQEIALDQMPDMTEYWSKTDDQLSVGNNQYKTYADPGAVTVQRLLNGTLTKTMYNWDGLTYTISAEGGVPANYNLAYPLSGGTIATRQYVDAYLGDISALIHES